MHFQMDQLDGVQRYRLLTSSITPRPIAWVTSVSTAGTPNAAPFSCFNMLGHTPPMIVLGIQSRDDGSLKDTARNIIDSGEMVVNLVCEDDALLMNQTSADMGPEADELELSGIAVAPSLHVAPPRISSAPVSFECRAYQVIQPSGEQTIVLGEVLAIHVRDELVHDAERLHLDNPGMKLLGRLQGPGWYIRCSDRLQIAMPQSA